MEPDRIDELIGRYLDGIATEPERVEMEASLRSSPDLARRFARAVRMDQALHRHYHRVHAAAAAAALIREAERTHAARTAPAADAAEYPAAGWRSLWGRTWDHLWGPAGAIALHVVLLVLLVRWVATDLRPRREEGVEVTLTREETRQFDRKPPAPVEEGDATAALAHTPPIEPLRAPGESEPVEPPEAPRERSVVFLDARNAANPPGLAALPPAYEGRRPERRAQILASAAGLPAARIEAAQAQAQSWLLAHQSPDGSWPARTADDRRAASSLAVLALLAHAENTTGERSAALARAVRQLMAETPRTGGRDAEDPRGAALACAALADFHAMTRVPAVREALDLSVRRLVSAQGADGLWRRPAASTESASDGLAPTAWAVQALRASLMAGADRTAILPAVARAADGLDRVQNPASGLFYYPAPAGTPARAMADTAAAVVALQEAGRGDTPRVQRGLKALDSARLPWPDESTGDDVIEPWFFIASAHRNAGGAAWIRVYRDLAGRLLERQTENGGWSALPGSGAADDLRATALCTLCLATPYAQPASRELDRLAPLAREADPRRLEWLAVVRLLGCVR